MQELRAQRTALENAEGDNQPAIDDLSNRINSLTYEQRRFKSITQRIALWIGLGFGLLISAVGIRTLANFVHLSAMGLSPFQTTAFHMTDILVTGGLIAGGSEGIHKVALVFTNFMDATANRAKGTPPTPG